MSKKYLIEYESIGATLEVTEKSAKEVDVLDDVEGVLSAYQNGNLLFFHEYLKANKYLIVKIIE